MTVPPLLVSLPGAQVNAISPPASLFGWAEVLDAPIPPELRLALLLVRHHAEAQGTAVTFVARPEIFTHGLSRAWLDARMGGATDHLILSDGHTLKTLPGLRNHLFFYARGLVPNEHALRRILRVAPDRFAGLASQVNGALGFRLGGRWVKPPVTPMRFATTPGLEHPMLLPFAASRERPEATAETLAEAAVEAAEAPPEGRPLHYVPLSEAALADGAFVLMLARWLQRAALGVAEEVPLLGLPCLTGTGTGLVDQVAALLRALAATGLPFPDGRSWSARLATAPPGSSELAGGAVTLHPGTPFWRLGADLFAAAARVEVCGGASLLPFRDLLAGWAGREPALRRPGLEAGRAAVTVGAIT